MGRQDIRQVVSECREAVVTKRGGSPGEYGSSEFLYGQCKENAEILANELKEQGFQNVYIVRGALDLPQEAYPTSYEEAEEMGTLHHWVIVEENGVTYHCNLVVEDEVVSGDLLVSTTLPKPYVDFGHRERI